MVCATCGRENPANLVFCQDCGARLAARIAPPTPPIGLTTSGAPFEVAAPPAAPIPSEAPPSQRAATPSMRAPRPSAPDFNFMPRESERPTAYPGPTKPEGKPERIRCANCSAMNAPHLRFCMTCGSDLAARLPAPVAAPLPSPAAFTPSPPRVEPVSAPRPAPVPSPSPVAAASAFGATVAVQPSAAPAPAPPAPPLPAPPIAPIAPIPVVDLGARPSAKPTVRVCARCHGSSDPNSQFCKFCGAPLNDAPVVAATSAAPPVPATSPVATPPSAAVASPAPAPSPASPQPTPPVAAANPLAAPNPVAAANPVAATPATSPGKGRLIAIAKDGGEGASYEVGDSIDIGRVEGDIVVGDDPYISPRHARLSWKGAQLRLRDLGSTNGIYVKIPGPRAGTPSAAPPGAGGGAGGAGEEVVLVEVPLTDQDLILLGQQVIRFEVVKGAEEGLGAAAQHGTLLFGTPASPRYARLAQRTVEGVVRDVFHVRKGETVLGREMGDVVFPDDPFLSRRHAVIRYDVAKRTFAIADFGSSNGTFLQIRGEVSLKHGDEFRIGQQLFRVELPRGDQAS